MPTTAKKHPKEIAPTPGITWLDLFVLLSTIRQDAQPMAKLDEFCDLAFNNMLCWAHKRYHK